MKQKYFKINSIIRIIIFLAMLGLFFVGNFNTVLDLIRVEVSSLIYSKQDSEFLTPDEIETSYEENFYRKMDFVDLNGFVHKIAGQKLVNGAIKGEHKKLFLSEDKDYKFNKNQEYLNVQDACCILNKAKDMGAEVLYVQRPMKFIQGEDKLPYGMTVEYNDAYDFWVENISLNGIDTIDLRASLENKLEFYKTDHHWTVESSFYAAKNIIEFLDISGNGEVNFNVELFDEKKYSLETYGRTFLGSEGVKTGKYYVGKDKFNILVPDFDTNFSYKHYIDGKLQKNTEGTFKEAFVDENLLKDNDYYNKYNACLYGGYVENIILNNNCTNGKKLLLISDSYARPMVMYLGLAFSEIHYLDPQEGRYNESYIEYINEYKPDVVIMMYSGEFIKI